MIPIASPYDASAPWWRDLDEWVDWLLQTYEFGELAWPSCWRNHGGFLQEVLALRLEHASVVGAQNAHALIAWHADVDELRERADRLALRCDWGQRCKRAPAPSEQLPAPQPVSEDPAQPALRVAGWAPSGNDQL